MSDTNEADPPVVAADTSGEGQSTAGGEGDPNAIPDADTAGILAQDAPVDEDDGVRPWHGADSPLEALYQWIKAELTKLKGA